MIEFDRAYFLQWKSCCCCFTAWCLACVWGGTVSQEDAQLQRGSSVVVQIWRSLGQSLLGFCSWFQHTNTRAVARNFATTGRRRQYPCQSHSISSWPSHICSTIFHDFPIFSSIFMYCFFEWQPKRLRAATQVCGHGARRNLSCQRHLRGASAGSSAKVYLAFSIYKEPSHGVRSV